MFAPVFRKEPFQSDVEIQVKFAKGGQCLSSCFNVDLQFPNFCLHIFLSCKLSHPHHLSMSESIVDLVVGRTPQACLSSDSVVVQLVPQVVL